MTEPEVVFKALVKAGLVTEVFDQALNKKVIMLTPKGAEWYTLLAEVYGEPIKDKKDKGKIRLRAPEKGWKYWINKVMNSILDVMQAVAKFGRSIDKSTGGKPKKQVYDDWT